MTSLLKSPGSAVDLEAQAARSDRFLEEVSIKFCFAKKSKNKPEFCSTRKGIK